MRFRVNFEGEFPIANGDEIICHIGNMHAIIEDGDPRDFGRRYPSAELFGEVRRLSVNALTAALEKDYYLNPSPVPDTFIRIGEALLRVQIMPVNLGNWDRGNSMEIEVRLMVQDASALGVQASRLGRVVEALPG